MVSKCMPCMITYIDKLKRVGKTSSGITIPADIISTLGWNRDEYICFDVTNAIRNDKSHPTLVLFAVTDLDGGISMSTSSQESKAQGTDSRDAGMHDTHGKTAGQAHATDHHHQHHTRQDSQQKSHAHHDKSRQHAYNGQAFVKN